MPVIEEAGVRVTLENLPYPQMPLNNMQALREVIDPYPSAAVGLIIDLGHVGRVERDPADDIRAAGDRLCGTHMHDLNVREDRADHHSPTLGCFDWTAIRAAFAEIGYQGPWTMEVIQAQPRREPGRTGPRDLATGWRPGYRGLRLIAASVPTSMRWLALCLVMILALGWGSSPSSRRNLAVPFLSQRHIPAVS